MKFHTASYTTYPYQQFTTFSIFTTKYGTLEKFQALGNMHFVIPIPKPGKDKFRTEGYRPISLLNIMCKILEKIIDSRLR